MEEIIEGEVTEAQPEQPQLTPQQVRDQQLKDLLAWLDERGLQIVPVAIGTRHGTQANISEFLPHSHIADWWLTEKPQ